MESVEYILRVRVPLSESKEYEEHLTRTAKTLRGKLSRIQREEHGTYSLHKNRKTLVP